jgi:hypothetical protein
MIVRQGGLVTLAGITVGLAAALAGSRVIETLLYDVSPRDPVVFVTAMLSLTRGGPRRLLAARTAGGARESR